MFPWGSFPFNKEMSTMMKGMKPDAIEQYVREAIEAYLPKGTENAFHFSGGEPAGQSPAPTSAPSGKVQASIFITHDFVYARMPISEDMQENLRLYHTSNQLFIENLPGQGEKLAFDLPAVVKKKGATASVRDGILEIRLIRAIDVQLSEINFV
ncbi:Hsp20/alpha crystallin family protein [Bacillus sp. FJAT-27245]|uniref:Hsp20/alpha crystallin family protein n=1 Tax=Bacillus sp. FJAT-27245 TaxID=1684144 RepID=UPI0006A7EEF4|nr:Hsp20/alpha crystallin family protein [Bacillus sp. FJAT-27245]